MRTVNVDSDSLASILLLIRELEKTPEPFRGQPDVTIIVDFEEYLKFVDTFLGDENLLTLPTKTLQDLIREHRQEYKQATKILWCTYLSDMAKAVMKEVYYAEQLDKEATRIQHYISNADVKLDKAGIDLWYQRAGIETQNELLNAMTVNGFTISRVSDCNIKHLKYACVLYYFSRQECIYWTL